MTEHEATEETAPAEPIPPSSDVVSDAPDLTVTIVVEPGRKMTTIRCKSNAGIYDRARDQGPFGTAPGRGVGAERAELLHTLGHVCESRTRFTSGLAHYKRSCWGPYEVGVVPDDAAVIAAGLRALFAHDDERVLREFIANPPALPRGEPWSPPDPRF